MSDTSDKETLFLMITRSIPGSPAITSITDASGRMLIHSTAQQEAALYESVEKRLCSVDLKAFNDFVADLHAVSAKEKASSIDPHGNTVIAINTTPGRLPALCKRER